MPAIKANSDLKPLILVSGATGYIAAWVVRVLLERGYCVRGTVRSKEKGEELIEELQKKIGFGSLSRFHHVIVEDISKPGAFDEAVKDVDAVEHVASPVQFKTDIDPRELIDPAVNGTIGLLQSVKNHGGKVKRVVITSSVAAITRNVSKEPVILTEEDWNEMSVKEVEEKGKDAVPINKYRASKTLAEKAAWKFVAENQPLSWDLVVLNPPYVFGPITNVVKTPASLGLSTSEWYKLLLSVEPDAGGMTPDALALKAFSWVDVRDLAEAHARALERQEAGGHRIIVSAGDNTFQDWLDIGNNLVPPFNARRLAKGVPGSGKESPTMLGFSAEKAQRLLGMSNEDSWDGYKYKSMETLTRDMLDDYAARGW